MSGPIKTLFPYFGGKSSVAQDVWARLGSPKQYLEPFGGSLAMLMAKPGGAASLEVVGDANGFIANFWRAAKHQPYEVAKWADYPVSHIDQSARHKWLMDTRQALEAALHDPDWHGDAKIAGWWLWGQCSWIGAGWCDWWRKIPMATAGKIPHVGNAGRGIQAAGQIPHVGNAGLMTSGGRAALVWLEKVAARTERTRIIHGDWNRCMNHHYGGNDTAVFLDPPYLGYEAPYGKVTPTAMAVAEWALEHQHLRIALCGHIGDYTMPGWDAVQWSRDGNTYGSDKTKDSECIWYSPACLPAVAAQHDLFAAIPAAE